MFVETEHFMLDLPAFAEVLGSWLQSKQGEWRPNVLKFALNLLDDLQPRAISRDLDWGVPIPLDGWRDQPNKRLYVWFDAVIGYLSASDRVGQALRRPRRVAAVVAEPRRPRLLLHGQGQHRLPRRDLAGDAARLQRPGRPGRHARARSARSNLPSEVVSSEFLTMEGRKFSSSRQVVIYVRDFLARYDADALRYYIAVAGPGEPGHRLHLAGVRQPQQRRAGRGLGQPGQPVDLDGGQELRRDPRGRRADRRRPGAAGALAQRPSRPVGAELEPLAVQERHHRGVRRGPRGQQVPRRAGAVEAQGRPGAAEVDPARRAPGRRRRQDAAHAVPAQLVQQGPRDARRRRASGRACRRSTRSTRTAARPTR